MATNTKPLKTFKYVVPSDQVLYPVIKDIIRSVAQQDFVFEQVEAGTTGAVYFGVETHTEIWTYSPKQLNGKPNAGSVILSAVELYLGKRERSPLTVPYIVTNDLSALTGKTWVIDIETGGTLKGEPEDRPQLCLSIWDGNKNNPVHVIPAEQYPADLGQQLSEHNLVCANAKFDTQDLNYWLKTNLRARHDTQVMHYALHSGASEHGLKTICRLYLGVDDWDRDVKKHVKNGDYSTIPRDILYEYNAKDVYYTALVWQYLNERLSEGQRAFYEDRMLKSHFLQKIEEGKGIHIDVEYFEQLDRDMTAQLEEMLQTIPLNPNSPKQVGEYFGIKVTDKEALSELDHPIAKKILAYREISKLHGTYVKGMLKRRKGSYVHPSFKVTGTVTGRLSSENPNAQNIPRKSPIKKGMCAPAGYKVISADYSQIEARVMAVLSGDTEMQKAFQRDSPDFFDVLIPAFFPEKFPTYEDYYTFKYVEHNGVDKHYRTIAKGVFYGLAFDRSAKAIGIATGLSTQDAQKIINNFARAYKKLWAWREERRQLAVQGKLAALTGMVFEQEIPWPSPIKQGEIKRSGLSFMPQHHANQCLLNGMMLFDELLDPNDGWIHGLVHDCGYVYVKEELAEHYGEILSRSLEKAATELLGDAVVYAAEPSITDDWDENE